MSQLRGLGLVAGRELREALRRKAFWAVVVLLFAGATAGMVVPDLLGDDGPARYDIGVVDGAAGLEASIARSVDAIDATARIRAVGDVAAALRAVDAGDLDVAVVGAADPQVIVRASEHERLVGAVQQAIAVESLSGRLRDAGLDPEEVADVLTAPAARLVELDEDDAERRGASAVVTIVLYMMLFTLMVQVSNGVAIEKSNRVSEVLLAIVRPQALLLGKVLGVGALGLLTLSAALVPVIAKLASGGELPTGLGPAVASGAAWFVLGLLVYLTLAGALGALVERQEEAGSVVSPLMAVLVATFILVSGNPDSTLGAVLAYVPFTSPLVEPARMAMGVSSPVEAAASLVIGVITVAVILRVGGTIYARAVVRTGRRLKLRDVLR